MTPQQSKANQMILASAISTPKLEKIVSAIDNIKSATNDKNYLFFLNEKFTPLKRFLGEIQYANDEENDISMKLIWPQIYEQLQVLLPFLGDKTPVAISQRTRLRDEILDLGEIIIDKFDLPTPEKNKNLRA